MYSQPLSLLESVRRSLVIHEQAYITDNLQVSVEERERLGVSGWGRTGVIDPRAYDVISESVTGAIEKTRLISPRWTFLPPGVHTEGTVVTGDRSVAEDLISRRGRDSVTFHLIGCYCGWEEDEDDTENRDDTHRSYQHYDRDWMVNQIITPAVTSPFGGGESSYARALAEAIWWGFGSLTPAVFETTLGGVVTRSESEVRCWMRAGLRVTSNRLFLCRSAGERETVGVQP